MATLEEGLKERAVALGYDPQDPEVQNFIQSQAQTARQSSGGASDDEILQAIDRQLPAVGAKFAQQRGAGEDILSKFNTYTSKYGAAGQQQAEKAYEEKAGQAKTAKNWSQAIGAAMGVQPEQYKGFERTEQEAKKEAEKTTLGAFERERKAAAGEIESATAAEKYRAWQRENEIKYKNMMDESNPDSDISKALQGTVLAMTQTYPQLAKVFEGKDITKMSAAQLGKIVPYLDKVSDNFQKRMEIEQKKELAEAKNKLAEATLSAKTEAANARISAAAAAAAERNAAAQERLAQGRERITETQRQHGEQELQKLSKDVSGVQPILSAVENFDKTVAKYTPGFKLDEYDPATNKVKGKEVDIPGVSTQIPGLGRQSWYSEGARTVSAAAAKIFNVELKDRSGSAVTNQEMDRLREEFNRGTFNTESELLGAIQQYKNLAMQELKNREAAFSPETKGTYAERGGRLSGSYTGAGGSTSTGGAPQRRRYNPETGQIE